MARDITLADTIQVFFTTRAFATGIPTVLAGSPVISAYEDASLTQITAGVTLTVSHDAVVGLNRIQVVATGANGFELGKDYHLVITTGTVGGVSVVGEVVGDFQIGRGAAAVDLANATDGLGAIKAETALILADTDDIGVAGAGLTAINLPNQTMDIVGNITGNLSGSVGSVTGAVGSVTAAVTLAAAAIDDIWDELLAGHVTVDSAAVHVKDILADVTGIAGAAMRGTDGANTVVPPTVAQLNARTILAAAYFDPAVDSTIVGTINANVINAASINAAAFTAAKFAANWLEAGGIVAAALNGKGDWNIGKTGYSVNALAANTITAASINAAAFIAAKFGTDFITSTSIAANAIGASELATDAIGAAQLAADAVDEIRDGLLPTQNLAFNNMEFLFVAATDHATPVTGATGTSGTRSIDGGAFGAVTGTIAEVGNGIYQFDASAADMNGGIITFRFIATGGTPGAPDDRFVTIVTGGGV